MGSKRADGLDLEQQAWAATEAIREAVLRLLQAGDLHPNVVVLAVARVAGETGAAAALASEEDLEQLLDVLAKAMRRAGLEQHAAFQREGLPVTGHA